MSKSKIEGWGRFLDGFPWYKGENQYKIQAYSEYMPPLQTGFNPVDGTIYPWVFHEDDMFGWSVPEIEEEYQLRPGLESIGLQILEHIIKLGSGKLPAYLAGHNQRNLANNLFWPAELASNEGILKHEKYISIQPLSLSKTKDDKGRVCWTFFGASEQGPEKGFWKSFYDSPEKELPESTFIELMSWIFLQAYGIRITDPYHLKNLGFRILPSGDFYPFPYWKMDTLPSWTMNYLVADKDNFENISYLLTFRPFGKLPPRVKEKYLAGSLALIPFPGSLALWGVPEYIRLQKKLYNAIQVPLLRLVKRQEGSRGIRVPQSGWLNEPGINGRKAKILEELIVESYIRTNRWDKVHRHEDGLLKSTTIDAVIDTLFSTELKDLDLYNKPMARNSQFFNESIELLLDGPNAGRQDIRKAALKVLKGGLFRYRFYFPPMRAGIHELLWHRPLVACISHESGDPVIAPGIITGYMTGYETEKPDLENPVELWPRLKRRKLQLAVLTNFNPVHDHYLHQTSLNLMALFDTWELLGKKPLNRDFARSLLRIPKDKTLWNWKETLREKSLEPSIAEEIIKSIESVVEPAEEKNDLPESLTFRATANRDYEERYWNQIRFLAHGEYINKDNADIVQDQQTLQSIGHSHRDLHHLGDYLIKSYHESFHLSGMDGLAEVGELPFHWETDFEFNHYGGWKANQEGSEYERNILVIIPGKNRKEVVIMADHYDTAYMADLFDTTAGGTGARISAAGADDNHSATSTLLLGAPIFLKMAKEGKLERDIWLLHLTGEEFPSDCMGARNFCQHVVQGTLKMRQPGNSFMDLSGVRIKGVLVMDMIAHNRDNARDIFQVAPGNTEDCLRLAYEAHIACRTWNSMVVEWNEKPDRKGCQPGRRTTDVGIMPAKALFLKVDGEIRTWEDPHSTLYNTDGLIFADTGIPVILFMENYDINRTGYHDTHDTMENIDLDYGAAVSAIAIETIARLAI